MEKSAQKGKTRLSEALSLLPTLWRHRSLVLELIRRDFSGRYQGSLGGVVWSLAQPLFLLTIYTIAFGVILKARWGFSGTTTDYALMLFAGLIIFNAFAEILAKSPTLITSNPNFVKKIRFPLELLPVVTVATALIHACIGTAVWLAGYALLIGTPHASILLFPLIFACFIPVMLGTAWLLAALGVMVRDITQVTSMVSHALLFLTPIFYSIEAAPPILQKLLLLNPLTFIVEQFRLVLFYGLRPALTDLAIYFTLSCLFATITLLLFKRLRPAFADMV